MNPYEIVFERAAERAIRRLPKDLATRLDRTIRALAENPRPPGCGKLAGFDNLYRIRVGDWRVVYAVEDERLVVVIIEVGSRGGAYRNL